VRESVCARAKEKPRWKAGQAAMQFAQAHKGRKKASKQTENLTDCDRDEENVIWSRQEKTLPKFVSWPLISNRLSRVALVGLSYRVFAF